MSGIACLVWFALVGTAANAEPGAHPSRSAGSEARSAREAKTSAPPPSASESELPVLLVPGWLDSARDLAALRIRFLAAGWTQVRTITFRDPVGSNREHAEEIESAVTELLRETGSEKVDLVAHSMGGLAVRWYLMTRSPAPVRRVAFLGSPHRGTLAAHLAWGEGGEEMTPGSSFLDSLNSRAPEPADVEAVTVRTPIDTHVVPGESATLPGIPDHSVCCPSHTGLLHDDEVFGVLVDFLEAPDPSIAERVP